MSDVCTKNHLNFYYYFYLLICFLLLKHCSCIFILLNLYYINICVLCRMFILTRILYNTIEYHCINMMLYKLINIYI